MIFVMMNIGKPTSTAIFAILFSVLLFIEYSRTRNLWIWKSVIGKMFGKLLRKNETFSKFKLKSVDYFVLAALSCDILFDRNTAILSMTVMIIGDTLSAIVGTTIGQIKIANTNKTLEGAVTMFVATFAILLFFKMKYTVPITMFIIILSSFVATIMELYSASKFKIDDNLGIALGTGVSIEFIGSIIYS